LFSKSNPRTKAQFRDGQSSFSDSAVFHRHESTILEVHLNLDADQLSFLAIGLLGKIKEFAF
jgi:hypothetical protein